jgi:ribosomal-protein-alanine N-acetyltransferase
MDGIIVCPMTVADIDSVMDIEISSFRVPWSRQAFEQELLCNRFAHYLVARHHGTAIAYGGMWFILDEAHITNIAVHSQYRRKGIGKLLLGQMICYARQRGIQSLTLEVRAGNREAIGLYSKLGFIQAGVRKGYYSDNGEDALIMWWRAQDYNTDGEKSDGLL